MNRRFTMFLIASSLAAACGGGGGGVSHEQKVQACVSMASCLDMPFYANFCINPADDILTENQLRCVLDAQPDCAEVLGCVGALRTEDPTCQSSCEGNVRLTCNDGIALRADCGSAPLLWGGPVCVEDDAGTGAYCAAGTCSTDGSSCAGSRVQVCGGGVLFEYDCAPSSCHDGTCSDGPPAACEVGVHCDGHVLWDCFGGTGTHIDCSQFADGWTCHTEDNGFSITTGCGPAGECPPWSDVGCSSATEIAFCDSGTPSMLNCTDLGFTACENDRCVP